MHDHLRNSAKTESGAVEYRQPSIDVRISDEQAREKVGEWLVDDVSTSLEADSPTFIVGERPMCRVPVTFYAIGHGRVGEIGTIDVDAITSESDPLVGGVVVTTISCEIEHIQQIDDGLQSGTLHSGKVDMFSRRTLRLCIFATLQLNSSHTIPQRAVFCAKAGLFRPKWDFLRRFHTILEIQLSCNIPNFWEDTLSLINN